MLRGMAALLCSMSEDGAAFPPADVLVLPGALIRCAVNTLTGGEKVKLDNGKYMFRQVDICLQMGDICLDKGNICLQMGDICLAK